MAHLAVTAALGRWCLEVIVEDPNWRNAKGPTGKGCNRLERPGDLVASASTKVWLNWHRHLWACSMWPRCSNGSTSSRIFADVWSEATSKQADCWPIRDGSNVELPHGTSWVWMAFLATWVKRVKSWIYIYIYLFIWCCLQFEYWTAVFWNRNSGKSWKNLETLWTPSWGDSYFFSSFLPGWLLFNDTVFLSRNHHLHCQNHHLSRAQHSALVILSQGGVFLFFFPLKSRRQKSLDGF